jgi:CheY-like chemotaxis protein
VVDDNDGIRELVSDVLNWAGHVTKTAPDGLAALDVVQRWSPDVIVLDAMMPRMDGCQFARSYLRLPGPHAPIIALTAASDGPARAAEMHAAGFVGKPFDPAELLRLVGRCAGAGAGAA